MYGGVIDNQITSEMWELNLSRSILHKLVKDFIVVPNVLCGFFFFSSSWIRIDSRFSKNQQKQVAVAGHTAHVIDAKMYVVFGFNPERGFVNSVQEIDLGMKHGRTCTLHISRWSCTLSNNQERCTTQPCPVREEWLWQVRTAMRVCMTHVEKSSTFTAATSRDSVESTSSVVTCTRTSRKPGAGTEKQLRNKQCIKSCSCTCSNVCFMTGLFCGAAVLSSTRGSCTAWCSRTAPLC